MARTSTPMSLERKRFIKAVRIEYRRLAQALAPQLAAFPDPEQRNINIAQNVLRDALSTVLVEMLPYSHYTAIELSRRLASYALSTVPLEDQDMVVAHHLAGFADFHMARTAGAQIIASDWQMEDGSQKPNFPLEGCAK